MPTPLAPFTRAPVERPHCYRVGPELPRQHAASPHPGITPKTVPRLCMLCAPGSCIFANVVDLLVLGGMTGLCQSQFMQHRTAALLLIRMGPVSVLCDSAMTCPVACSSKLSCGSEAAPSLLSTLQLWKNCKLPCAVLKLRSPVDTWAATYLFMCCSNSLVTFTVQAQHRGRCLTRR